MELIVILLIIALGLGLFPLWYAVRHDVYEATASMLIASILGLPYIGWIVAWWVVVDHMDKHPKAKTTIEMKPVNTSTFPLG